MIIVELWLFIIGQLSAYYRTLTAFGERLFNILDGNVKVLCIYVKGLRIRGQMTICPYMHCGDACRGRIIIQFFLV